MHCIYIAFLVLCNQRPPKALYNIAFTHSHIYAHVHTATAVVSHARRQPARRDSGAVRVRCLAQGHLGIQARRSQGFEPATLINLLSSMPPMVEVVEEVVEVVVVEEGAVCSC